MINVRHYRVPEVLETEDNGQPTWTQMWRYWRNEGFDGLEAEPKCRGGATSIEVVSDFELLAAGESFCSLSENFDYRSGREKAACRVIKDALLNGVRLEEEDIDALLDMIYRGERINY